MKAARILLFDLDASRTRGEELKAMVDGRFNSAAEVRHERADSLGVEDSAEAFNAAFKRAAPDLVILALGSWGRAAVETLFRAVFARKQSPPVAVVPFSDDPDSIRDLFQLGASDFLLPPFRAVDVLPRLERLLEYSLARSTPASAAKEALGLHEFVGESAALLEQIRKIPRLARCDACVLITGETGTGKEVCARSIHYLSPRAQHAFVPLNCGAVPVSLLENELFGHAAGAYTGAQRANGGVIEEAHGGTLFLDEIDSLPLTAQVKLLRFLQEKEYRPLGARKSIEADVRIIAASNAEPEDLVRAGKLRRDFFYRLNVLPLRLPPLRQRREDIPLLARHFLEKRAPKGCDAATGLTPGAMQKLLLHDWPGNVRELENVIERAAVLSDGGPIHACDIGVSLPGDESDPAEQSFSARKARVVADFERSYVRTMLELHQGNIAHAAHAAQKNRRVFFELMRKHRIRVQHPKQPGRAEGLADFTIVVGEKVHPLSGSASSPPL